MSTVIHVPLERWRPQPPRRVPRVPQRIVVFKGLRESLTALFWTALLVIVFAAAWAPVFAVVQLCRRLHHH